MTEYKKNFSTQLSIMISRWIHVKILFCLGILISFLCYIALSNFESGKQREKFFNIAEYQANMIQETVSNQVLCLQMLHSFFEASENVTYTEFDNFMKNMLNILDEVSSVYWVPQITFSDKERFEQTASATMGRKISIFQKSTSGGIINVSPRDNYFPVYYAVPKQGNEKIIGLDLSTNYLCKEAIYNSVKSDTICASEKLDLLNQSSQDKNLFLFQPIYKKNVYKEKFKNRFSGLKGLVVISFNVNNFFKKELSSKSFSGIKINFFDVSNPLQKNSIFSMSSSGVEKNKFASPDYLGSELKYMTDIKMADRHYLFLCEPEKKFLDSGKTLNPIFVLILGIFITFLLSGYYLSILTRTKKIEKLVKLRTHELKENEQKYKTLFESSKDAIILFYQNKLIDCNTTTLKMFGLYSKSCLNEMDLIEFFNKIQNSQVDSYTLNEFIEKSANCANKEFEINLRRSDRSCFTGELTVQKFKIEEQKVLQLKIKDITERKKAEKSYWENQQIIHGIFNNANTVIYVKNITGQYILVNKQFEKLFNISNNEVIGKNDYQLLPAVIADMITINDKKVMLSKKSIAVEEKIDCKRTYLSLKFPLFDKNNEVYAVCGMSTDITERKNTEEEIKKFKTMADSANFAMAVVNMDWSIHYINKHLASLHGYDNPDIIKGTNYKLLYGNERNEQIKDLEKQLFETGSFVAEEIWHTALDGTKFPLLMNGVVIKDINDNPLYMAFSAIEVSERKRIEEELIKTRKLESAGVLAGGIAHDFNNLLTSIIGNIELCKMDLEDNSNLIAPLVNAEKAASIAKELSQQLLTFTQNEAPLKTFESIENLIADTVNFTLSGSDSNHDLYFENNLFPVKINKTQIIGVINNVLLNAVHAMPDGGKIKIRCENVVTRDASKQKNKYLKISITDTGIGIPEQNIEKIFDPYFTTKEKTTDKGSGLGLTTSYSIIKKHGGYMTAKSVVGKGSTIDIFIPANFEQTNENQEKKPAVKKDINVLIIDNENFHKKELEDIVSKIGFKANSVKYGKKAFEIYKTAFLSDNPFEVVILDDDIALDALEQLKDINPDAKIIITTYDKKETLIKKIDKYSNANIVSDLSSQDEMEQVFEKIL